MGWGKRILFFATKNDMVSVFKNYEDNIAKLQYIKRGNYNSENIEVYCSIDQVPNLGYLKFKTHCSTGYVVLNEEDEVNKGKLVLTSGETVFTVYSGCENPKSISFCPSGLYQLPESNSSHNCLIHGQLSTVSSDYYSVCLYKRLSALMRKQFTKANDGGVVRATVYYIGKEALELYGSVRFITISVDSPRDYDFKLS